MMTRKELAFWLLSWFVLSVTTIIWSEHKAAKAIQGVSCTPTQMESK